MGRAASALLALTLAACGGAAQPSPAQRTADVGAVTPTAAATVSASGPWTFTVAAGSKTTVRVREVLAQVRLPGDATLMTTGMKGVFVLNARSEERRVGKEWRARGVADYDKERRHER